MSYTASRYAESTLAAITALERNDDERSAALGRHDMAEVERLRLEAVGLVAVLRVRAAVLADLTLAAVPKAAPTPHACSNCEGTDPTSCWMNTVRA